MLSRNTFVCRYGQGKSENGFFIFNQRVTPAWSGFAAMTRLLGAGRFTQKHAFPGAEVYVRERSVRPGLVGVAWATGETPAMVESQRRRADCNRHRSLGQPA